MKNNRELPETPIRGMRFVELTDGDDVVLQRFFEENPLYFWEVNGEPAGPGEAKETIEGKPPEGWAYSRDWLIGVTNEAGSLVAMAGVISDLLAATVWHVGLFILATDRHGTGEAVELYQALESWAREGGARWMRLGVVQGNARAERFWQRLGYQKIRERAGLVMGKRTNTISVMMKPLEGGTTEDYLALVKRDRPESD